MLIDLPSFAVGGLVGGVAAVVVWMILRWYRGHHRPSSVRPSDDLLADGNAVNAPSPSLEARGEGTAIGRPATPLADQVRLSERIIIVLAREGRLGEDSLVRPVRTQSGLSSILGSNQSAVSKVLRRLVAAGLLTEDRRHVQGGSQRLKVYALTRRGELLAREVARRRNLSLMPDRTPAIQGQGTPTTTSHMPPTEVAPESE